VHCTDLAQRDWPRPEALAPDRRLAWLALAIAAVAAALAGCAAPRASAPAPEPVTRSPAPAPAPAAAAPTRQPLHRNWSDYRLAMARQLVVANPAGTYTGVVKQPLLAIPVLEIELNGDGSIRNLSLMRKPSQATETVQMAMDAVRRAAPFGEVSHLPKPWKVTETFLFNDDKRFKPMTLDQ
jgi:hypothetical protein